MSLRRIALAAMAMIFFDARACVAPPAEQHAPIDELIASADTIVLAKPTGAVRLSPYRVAYTLEAVSMVSGKAVSRFEIIGRPRDGRSKGLAEWNFEDHTAKVFWEDDWAGSVFNHPDCKLYPSFALGGTYLVFLGDVPHVKGFERIHDPSKDQWLKYVQAHARP